MRESAAPGPSRAALPVLAAAAALLIAGTLAYRLGNASQSVTLAIAQAAFPAPVQVHAAALREAVPHPEEPPSAAPDPTREHGMRELQEALENAWRAGLAEAATATADSPGVSADPPTGESAIAAATATTATAIATPTPTATPTATATTTETPSPTADPGAATAALSPTLATTTHVADEGPHDDHLVVYTAPGCSACSLAKEWMTAYGIPFEERDIDASSEYAQEVRRLRPGPVSIPTFEIDGDVLVGLYPRRLVAILRRAVLRHAM